MESKRFASFIEFLIDRMTINLKKFGHVSTVEVDDFHFYVLQTFNILFHHHQYHHQLSWDNIIIDNQEIYQYFINNINN